MIENEEKYYLINATGQDRAGLIAKITKVVADGGFNIIDIEQSAPHGLFYIIMIIEPTNKALPTPLEYFNEQFQELSSGTDLNISIKPFKGGIRKSSKSWLSFVFVGTDKPGLIASLSNYAGQNNANIHKLNMISRGQIIACESLLNVSDLKISRDDFILGLRSLGKELGLQIIIESENVFRKKTRKLLILDLDENLIQIQDLNKFLNEINLNDSDKNVIEKLRITKNSQDIKEIGIESLRGLKINILDQLISSIRISPGTEEFIRALKLMEYTIALLSNSLSYFTDLLKERLNLEYAFGNAIEVSDGKITGKFIKTLEISPQKKQRLVNWLAVMEKVPEMEVVKFGLDDIEKDPILSHSAGLKISISFNYEEIKKMIQQCKITASQIIGLFISIGMIDSQIDKIRNL
ncbi:MAG: ACT domain-containing protein [Promethearchaeota archaeon]|jgi:phosphoserine phosphatase